MSDMTSRPRKSAGLLCYRIQSDGVQVLLVHPGGPFWAKKDDGAWSIPKGEFTDDEDPLDAAKREFAEEIGSAIEGEFIALDPVTQAGGKVVHAWAVQADVDPARLKSNTFTMEWPPKSGRQCAFPEVDRAEWFSLEIARVKILRGQAPLLDQLARRFHEAGR